jgi:hypothetical protein
MRSGGLGKDLTTSKFREDEVLNAEKSPEKLRGLFFTVTQEEFGGCKWSLGTMGKEAATLMLRRQENLS